MARAALVTGASSGIGRGLALALARRGYHVLAVGRDPARLDAVAREIEQLSPASTFRVDLADPVARARLIDEVLQHHGAPDLLVNNAATRPAGEFLEQPVAVVEQALAVNLAAPAVLARRFCAGPGLATRGVIFVVSTAARFPQPYASLYSATKSGLRALAECLQVELAGRTRICLAYPPLTRTAMTEALAGRSPVRVANPEEVAEQIIIRYEAGQDEIRWLDWERLPAALYQLAPGFFRWLLTRRRAQLKALLCPPEEGPD